MLEPNPLSKSPDHRGFVPPASAGNLHSEVYRCWVCNGVFPAYGGSSSGLTQEFHHVIPQAFGGRNGPTVSLCSGHHALAHLIGLRLKNGRNIMPNLPKDGLERKRVLFLADKIAQAMTMMENDPNKRFPLVSSLSREENAMLKSLGKKLGRSKADLIAVLIRKEFAAQFPVK